MPRNLPFCSFDSFLIVSLNLFISKRDSSREWTSFMISSIDVVPDPKIFFWIAAYVADVSDV